MDDAASETGRPRGASAALGRAEALLADPDADPAAVLAAFEAAADILTTPCGDGEIVWHTFGAGPAVAMLHGGHGSWLHWLRVIAPLARSHRLLVADMPGYGASGDLPVIPDEGTAFADAMARPIADGLAALCGEAPVTVVGFSFGGVVGARLVRMLGARAAGFVVIGSMGFGFPLGPPPPLRKVRNVGADALAEVHRANLAAMMFADPSRIDALAVHIQGLNVPRARAPSRLASRSAALLEALPEIAAPVTAIYGERDSVAFQHAERWEILAAHPAGARQHVLPGVGHWAQYEAADTVAPLIARAIAEPPGVA
ncbi:alpha/beta fold hydrolase [Acuticoccus sp. I52.16.1]|uniref:alpha/beta fold hydrolase n=1 Tax=Acuticoccus sp. I52.16.1 TaxID=2928472 RepID=UPI001FD13376|nr:alpha/beta fold hydrolase [Acuticoccus sp. I52.16.1]UOM33260.1 alpha/beta hydrolase [Acuticoccus sp. I52.16.1]